MGSEFKIIHFTPSNLLHNLLINKYIFFNIKIIQKNTSQPNSIRNLIDPTHYRLYFHGTKRAPNFYIFFLSV